MSLFWVITFYIEPGIVPKVIYYKKIGLAPSFWVYVIPGAINAIYLVVFRTYMEHLPPELDEAAIMEGAGYWKRFIKITLPQCKPIVATVALFTASAQWYSWIDTHLYNRLNEKYYTLAYRYFANFPSHLLIDAVNGRSLEYAYRNAEYSESVLFCLLSIPIVILSLFCRRYFMPDIKIGDVKS